MIHGNISNKQSPILAFSLDLLYTEEPKAKGILRRLFKRHKKNINQVFVRSIESLWTKFDYAIVIVTDDQTITEEDLSELNLCYTKLIHYDSEEELRSMCRNNFTYLFSDSIKSVEGNILPFNNLWERVK